MNNIIVGMGEALWDWYFRHKSLRKNKISL